MASLREQLEVARALGLVEVRPRLGMKRRDYSFTPAVRQSLRYALALNDDNFRKFSELRNHVETAFWYEAVEKLTEEDKQELRSLVRRAMEKLHRNPIQVPHEEHRNLHLLIYSRLENPFVTGILEAYWDSYEAVGLNVFVGDLHYLLQVWDYHSQIVEAICSADTRSGYDALVAHTDLLFQRP